MQRWANEQWKNGKEFPTIGNVCFHVYKNRLTLIGGGIQFSMWYKESQEGDVKIEERRPNVFAVSVVPCGKMSIDYIHRCEFTMQEEIKVLREVFPNGRNTSLIVDELWDN